MIGPLPGLGLQNLDARTCQRIWNGINWQLVRPETSRASGRYLQSPAQ